MTKQFEINQQTFPKDYGEIVLYQRSDHKTPRWQTRIKINGAEHYIRKSTKTLDFNEALSIATELYLSTVDKFRATGLTDIKTFKEVVDEWLGTLSKNPKTISEFKSRLYNYPVRLWGDLPIDRLQQSDLVEFMGWRRSTGAIRPNPSNVTIKRDLVPLRQVLKYAYGKKYTSQHLIFDTFKAQSKRRPAFSEDEWTKIVRKLPEWVNQSIGHHRHFRDRFYLYKYILLIGYSGIRPGSEARSLTWGSLKSIDLYKDGGSQTAIEISRGKRGPRVAIPDQRINTHLAELKTFRAGELAVMKRHLTDDESIFCHESGQPIHSFKKGFRAFLENYDLLMSGDGRARTLYGLRHTYATLMIDKGSNHWDLACNMGTSVEQLERFYVHNNPAMYGGRILELTNSRITAHEEEPLDEEIEAINLTRHAAD